MTNLQKEHITVLRERGASYSKISAALNISENTIKSFCRRNNLGINSAIYNSETKIIETYCKLCGKELNQTPKGKKKKFCSYSCRMEWWKTHPNSVIRKANYSFTCHYCKNEFTAYGNKSRKFCSHACYINDRFGVSEKVSDGAVND
jgi:endogenous inhibitor of DNA gyrase (YacG/DUF329 family)